MMECLLTRRLAVALPVMRKVTDGLMLAQAVKRSGHMQTPAVPVVRAVPRTVKVITPT